MAGKNRITSSPAATAADREADSVVATLTTLGPERRDAVLEAARKLEILADALVSHSRCAEEGQFEDDETIAVVSSIAKRQSDLASVIIRAFYPTESVFSNSTAELQREARSG